MAGPEPTGKEQYTYAPYNLDPFLILDDTLARRLYGWEPALKDISRITPWVLLAKNMYGVLVGEAVRQGQDAGSRRPKVVGDVKRIGGVSLRNWAYAFNVAVKNQHKNAGYFKDPRAIDKSKPISEWEAPIRLNQGDPGAKQDRKRPKQQKTLADRWIGIKRSERTAVHAKILSVVNDYRERLKTKASQAFGENLLK